MAVTRRVAVLALAILCIGFPAVLCDHEMPMYALDSQATCGKNVIVNTTGVVLSAFSNTTQANPLTECVVTLQAENENTLDYTLKFMLDHNITDCDVSITLYSGLRLTASDSAPVLKRVGCTAHGSEHLNSKVSDVTVHFVRPATVNATAYAVTITIQAHAYGIITSTPDDDTGDDGHGAGTTIGSHCSIVAVVALMVLALLR